MHHSLYPVLKGLGHARTTSDVCDIAMDGIRSAFGARSGGVLFVDGAFAPFERAAMGISDRDVEEYLKQWRAIDRVFAAVAERGSPIRTVDVYPGDSLIRDPIYTQYGKRVDIFHYMSAPVFGCRGSLAGVLNFARSARDRAFTNADLHLAGTFAAFLSATLARVRAEQERMPALEAALSDVLTAREQQVARLAASGRNNIEIALRLGIARETVKQALRRVYRKLGVNGRAEMATKLALSGLLAR